jgi:regulator of cell morphogenesis and NO signaling
MDSLDPTFNADTPIGQLAVLNPLAMRVFERHQIDYYCGGRRSLGDVCREKGLNVDRVLREIQAQIAGPGIGSTRWEAEPPAALIDYILNRFHKPLREELTRLELMAREVVRANGDRDAERLAAVLTVYLGLKTDLERHMIREETTLFPMILKGESAGADVPIAALIKEHAGVATALRDLRALTGNYTIPEAGCITLRALWFGLEELEADLHEHIHVENNILFPRTLEP